MKLSGPNGISDPLITLIARQHGVVSRRQLLALDWSSSRVARCVHSGELRVVYRGVYLHGALVGGLTPLRFREMAAVLACGAGSVVSHRSAARLWDILPPSAPDQPVEMTVPGGDRGRRDGIRPCRVASLLPDDESRLDGIPLTSPSRTLVDLAGRVPPRVLEQAVARAERRGLTTRQEIGADLVARPRRPGSQHLRRLLAESGLPAFTRSAAEERLLDILRESGLPRPETNVPVGGYEVDFLWRLERVVVEVDGFAFHSSRAAFEADRRRDQALVALGFRTVRTTWRQLVTEPSALLVRLTRILTSSAHSRP